MQGDHGRRLVTLDGLRGMAAIAVMLYHIGNVYQFGGPFRAGYLFVDFFFLLSGFVLALSVEPRFARGWTTAAFMRARIVRLWPVIAIGALAGGCRSACAAAGRMCLSMPCWRWRCCR